MLGLIRKTATIVMPACLTGLLGWFAYAQTGDKQPPGKRSPAEAAKSFTVAEGLRFDQVLSEPLVRQPIALSFDERGRLWVAQYLQYPEPAGLKVVSRDIFWRVVYDMVPAAPPNHVRGADRITIHEDTDGDGVFDKHGVFVDGLNIATSLAHGRGGVWVLNPPYLLFYPTQDGDQPSGPPVVHLQGFGLEDTHSCASSLRWGPDGWLYGAHGSTVSAKITIPGDNSPPVTMIGQHIWRYLPEKKRFEVFAEGGGNAFGVEIDRLGRVFSGHNGGDTRGFHYVQGGYYRKGFEKHGALANPYTFGFFEAMAHNKAQRFSHTFVINEAAGLPENYRGKLFAVEPLQGRVMVSEVEDDRSSLKTRDLPPAVRSSDTWFRPVDIKPAPDGSLFVADFYEAKIAHLDHNAGRIDRETGRIYRLSASEARPRAVVDLGKKTAAELVGLLRSDNRWLRQTALRLLGDRRDRAAIAPLLAMLKESRDEAALDALWALNLTGGFDAASAESLLSHPQPLVRAWAVRLLADDFRLGALAPKVAEMAERDESVIVRSQWAASARRLPASEGLPIVAALLRQDRDAADIHVPLLLWWAIEAKCTSDRNAVVELFRDSSLWRGRLVEDAILPRLMKRFAMAGSQKDLLACVELFRLAPEKRHGQILLKGFEEAFKGRSIAGLPDELIAEIAKLGGGSLAFAVRQGRDDAIAKALQMIADRKAKAPDRIELIDVLGEAKQPMAVAALLGLLADDEPDGIRRAALGALQAYADERIGAEVVKRYLAWKGELRESAETLLASRRSWSNQWLAAVESGAIEPKSMPREAVRKLLVHRDKSIDEIVRKHWGDVARGATTAEMKADVERLAAAVGGGAGDPYPGKLLFTARCANCHVLHSHGAAVGPDLTPFKRDDVPHLLLHIVNPSAEIREGYENHLVLTESGRALNGVLAEKDARVVVLKTADGQKVVVPRDDIAEMTVSGQSLMPENLLQGLADQDVRDLFAYLRSSQPLNERKK
jgi:putative membrane-bound dehydrogenase-like protein